MQYIWQHRLLRPGAMATVDGRRVEIIDPGRLNTASGPDFFNAKVRINGEVWAGDVEIHVRASDWHRHGHDGDPAYESVVLHVVDADDTPIMRSNGETIPQMRLPAAPDFANHYNALVMRADLDLPCKDTIQRLPSIYLTDWMTALGMERLFSKAERVENIRQDYNGDWHAAFYITLARALGFGGNSEPFERLARATPLQFLLKHADNPITIEAILFGQAGLLDNLPPDNTYGLLLRREYEFMKSKFGIKQPEGLNWKRSGMRPQNSHHRRLALLCEMVVNVINIVGKLAQCESAEQAMKVMEIEPSGYWAEHSNFSPTTTLKGRGVGKSSLTSLVINVVIPFLYAYGRHKGDEKMCDRALEMLQDLPAENNMKVQIFTVAGIKCKDAFSSQALIELRRNYCENRKCLYCRIGHRMLAERALRQN